MTGSLREEVARAIATASSWANPKSAEYVTDEALAAVKGYLFAHLDTMVDAAEDAYGEKAVDDQNAAPDDHPCAGFDWSLTYSPALVAALRAALVSVLGEE